MPEVIFSENIKACKTFIVEGIYCSHCAADVVKSVEETECIDTVVADSKNNSIKITGNEYDLQEVINMINGL